MLANISNDRGRSRRDGRISAPATAGFARWSYTEGLASYTSLLSRNQRRAESALPNRTGFIAYRQPTTADINTDEDDLPSYDEQVEASLQTIEQFRGSGTSKLCKNNTPPLQIDITASTEDVDNRPPSPWANSSAKNKIIDELQDSTSDIHLHIGEYALEDFSQVNFKQIHADYAKQYKISGFRENLKRVLRHMINSTGPFKKEEDRVEPWTSRSKRSKGWQLLFSLRMDQSTNNKLNAMAIEEIWASDNIFKCYPLDDFKNYDRDMKMTTDKLKKGIEKGEKDFEQDCVNFPHNQQNDRGEPFWYNHPAKTLLVHDVESGLSHDMTPAALRETREEYKQFALNTFRKHIYQEQERQRAAPFWRHKRNIAAREKITKERVEMRQQWAVQRMNEQFASMNV
ncbi:hypothetical protein ACHAXR_002456 [Thalassiosira sp. AJA248-18]